MNGENGKIIIKNAVRCLSCGDVIESISVHDYQKCQCGVVSIDGGHEYLRRSFPSEKAEDSYEELSEFRVVTSNER